MVQVGVLIVLALDASIVQHAHAFSLDDFMDSLKSMAGSNGTDFRAKFGLVGQPSAGNLWMAQRQTAASSALDPVTVPSDLNTIPTLRRTYGELFFKNDTRRRDKAIDAQFEAMDKNDDGTLTTDEYRQAMLALVERLVDHGEDEHDPDDHDQDKHVRAPRTNEAALVDGLLGGNTTISGTFRAFDANSDGNVTRKEYSDSAMELWERSVVLMPALCEETSARLAVCPQLDMNATVSGLKEGVTMTYGEVQWIEDAQCR